MVAELSIFITFTLNGKRCDALRGGGSGETDLLKWHHHLVWKDSVAQLMTNTDFGSSCNQNTNTNFKSFFVCLFRSAQYLFFDPSLMVKIVSFITNPILGFFRDCLWTFLWTAVWHRASVHEYFGSDVAAFFMGALVVLLCAFEVQFFFLSWKLNVLHLHFLK